MSKSKVIASAVGAIIAILLVGNTTAYFVTSERARNVITTSGIGIELIEDTDQFGVDGRAIPFQNLENVTPGETLSKIPRVKNTDNGDAWVRIKMQQGAELENGESIELSASEIAVDLNSNYWLRGDDSYYYYYRALKAGETTEPLFTQVMLGPNLANEFAGAEFNIKLNAQATQVANNGTNVLDAKGWPEE